MTHAGFYSFAALVGDTAAGGANSVASLEKQRTAWRLDAGAAATAAVSTNAVMTYERAGTYALARELPEDAYYLVEGGVSVAYETDGTASFELLGGRADRVVSGVGRGSLTVGADADARITGLALTVAATEAGNTSFTSLRALADASSDDHAPRECASLHDSGCAPVDGVVFDEKQAMRTIIFGHRECCQHSLVTTTR